MKILTHIKNINNSESGPKNHGEKSSLFGRVVHLTKKNAKIQKEISVTLAGVPNVGKSTVFNAMTGMNQHTGNWTGKTVECAKGSFIKDGVRFSVTDIPGTYSLYTHSAEEDAARDFIVNGGSDLTVVVCDATCPERSLTLALQILEITDRVIVFFNLLDEAKKLKITVDTERLSNLLGVPVLSGTAKNKKDVTALADMCRGTAENFEKADSAASSRVYTVRYTDLIESAVLNLEEQGASRSDSADTVYRAPEKFGLDPDKTRDEMAGAFVAACDKLCEAAVIRSGSERSRRDTFLDRIFTGKYTAFPIMALLVIFIFWLTVRGANYPSSALWSLFCNVGEHIKSFLLSVSCPPVLNSFLTDGVYRVTSWIISVMLPPMAIFFPLFTLLEDFGYLPRVAFDLDRCFKKCGGCGKQALCMCMGLGCNAVGVTGCRIIDSRRERLIAIMTNSMVPCNGRFPSILTLAAVFFAAGAASSGIKSLVSAVVLFLLLVLSAAMTLFASKILSRTVLRGVPSSFTLELPPFRAPRLIETVVRSVFDRTVFVLGRAIVAAVPAGALIWLLANLSVGGESLLSHINGFFDPVGRLMGLDGVIITAFILGLPANETVLPIILMSYLAGGTLPEADSAVFVSEVLRGNGWTLTTAVCTVVFSLFHWPCATTLMTVKKETGSLKWTMFSALYPTLFGFLLCVLINLVSAAINALF